MGALKMNYILVCHSTISTYAIIIYLRVIKKKFEINWGVLKSQGNSRGMQINMKHRGGHIKFKTNLYIPLIANIIDIFNSCSRCMPLVKYL